MAKKVSTKKVAAVKPVDVVSEKIETQVKPIVKDDSSEFITLNLKKLSIPAAIIISVIIFTAGISAALYFGLKARPVNQVVTTTGTPTPTTQTFAANEFAEVSLPFVAGPTIGQKDAKVVIVEFSDLVCPYCKKFHDENFSSLDTDYFKTGKAQMVYKYFPLSFHEPAATLSAKASYCVDKIYGDAKMFEYHTSFFANTATITQNAYDKSNNPVINLVDKKFYAQFAALGVDATKIKNCMSSKEAADQLAADQAELNKFQTDIVAKGLSQGLGTPSFIVGTVKDGVLTGRLIEGAYPMVAFTNTIEEQLNK